MIRIAAAQIAPVWLDRTATLQKVLDAVTRAAEQECALVAFGEALVPGYPFWLELTDGARFDSPVQKGLHAHYAEQAVSVERGDLDELRQLAADRSIAVALGTIERPLDRGGHSLYCSLVYIDATGAVRSVHRKLMPTYEERLSWAPGDGHGLRVHPLGPFTVGALNCWENWMPLARASLYALGEDLHVATWPGSQRNTGDITRFIARESRSYVVSVSGLLRAADIGDHVPHAQLIRQAAPEWLADGGSCIAGPDGSWVVPPLVHEEQIIVTTIDHRSVLGERQNFDPAGHYGRPDVFRLRVDRRRQATSEFID